jgi:hypothetical protein
LACTEYRNLYARELHVIRGQQYVTEVIAVGEDVASGKGDVAVVSMYSGHHVTTTKKGTQKSSLKETF